MTDTYKRRPGLDKPAKTGTIPCTKPSCQRGGTPWGQCFRCGGTGTDPTGRTWEYPTGWTDEQCAAHAAKDAATKQRARDRAATKKATEADAVWQANVERFPILEVAQARRDEFLDRTFVVDILAKARRWPVSEAQAAALGRFVAGRDDAQGRREAQRIQDAGSRHLGAIGDKIAATITVTVRYEMGGRYGSRIMLVGRTADGDVVKTITAAGWVWDVEVGQTVTIAGTVDEHGDRDGVAQTILKRAKPATASTPVERVIEREAASSVDTDAALAAWLGE